LSSGLKVDNAEAARIVALSRWATVLVAIVAVVLSVSAVAATLGVIATVRQVPFFRLPFGLVSATETLVLAPTLVFTLILAIRRSGSDVLPYLGLDVPRWQSVALAVVALVVLIGLGDGLALVLGRNVVDPRQVELVRSAMADGSFIWMWIGIVVAGPIHEELLFRGFVFRGFVRSAHDVVPSIVLISLVWSLMHFPTNWYALGEIFVTGLLFGLVRWQTCSTTLTIILHVLGNLESMIETESALH
jgi:membrane protease YdiL (CAAX protease family)